MTQFFRPSKLTWGTMHLLQKLLHLLYYVFCIWVFRVLGYLGIWGFGFLGIWGFGFIGIWGFSVLGFWCIGVLGFGVLRLYIVYCIFYIVYCTLYFLVFFFLNFSYFSYQWYLNWSSICHAPLLMNVFRSCFSWIWNW